MSSKERYHQRRLRPTGFQNQEQYFFSVEIDRAIDWILGGIIGLLLFAIVCRLLLQHWGIA